MGLSSILDISSFFIGMIINLIFVALMCYYFKRKYDYLEMAQTEQAKILYQMIHKNSDICKVDYSKDPLVHMEVESDSDSDDESVESQEVKTPGGSPRISSSISTEENSIPAPTEIPEVNPTDSPVELSEPTLVEEAEPRMDTPEVREIVLDPFEITLQMSEPENIYSKMSMKQLKDILSSKGIRAKNNIKKDELIELISKEA